jgi:tripartite ATP-independent transporter DctP family solute receptor
MVKSALGFEGGVSQGGAESAVVPRLRARTQRRKPMKRSILSLTGVGVGALVVGLGSATLPGAAWAEDVWTCGGINPPKAHITIASEKFVEMVNARLKGKLKINYFGGSKLGDGPAQLQAISSGAQQCYVSSTSAQSALMTEWGLADAPFLFNSIEHYAKFMESDLAKDLNERMAKQFKVVQISYNWYRLPRVFVHRTKFIKTPADLKGVRVRAPNQPMFIAGWEAMGGVPVKTAYSEFYLSMTSGLVEGGESAGEQIYSSKIYEVAPYIVETEFNFPGNSVVANADAFNKLDAATRAELVKIANEAGDYYTKLVKDEFERERTIMMKAGAIFTGINETQKAEWIKLVRAAVPSFEEKNLVPKGWWDKIQALDKK